MMREIIVMVSPSAKRETWERVKDGVYKVSVKEAPERNEANRRVLELISRKLAIPRNTLTMMTGHRGRKKRIRIRDL